MKFRKKPAVIDAMLWKGEESFDELYQFAEANENHRVVGMKDGRGDVAQVCAPGGIVDVEPGDFVIKGVAGELYPCKPDVFAATYEAELAHVDFGAAISAAKEGKRIARAGWNGKDMFVFQRPADTLTAETIINHVKSLPQSVKDYYKSVYDFHVEVHPLDAKITFSAYLCMKAADGSIVNGWLASQTDMLATDWLILD